MVEKTWQEKEEDLKKKKDGKLWVQIGYISADDKPCEPVILSEEYTADWYPIVVKKPENLNNPKYDWTTHTWQERDMDSLSEKVVENSATNKKLADDLRVLKEQQNHSDQVQAKMAESFSNVEKNQAQTTVVLGQLAPAVQQLSQFAALVQQQMSSDKKEEGAN